MREMGGRRPGGAILAARGGAEGDLFVVIHLAKDSHFTRDGDDLKLTTVKTRPDGSTFGK